MKPILGITMGDPSGCGPEITVKAFLHEGIYEKCRPLVVGDAATIERAACEAVKNDSIKVRRVSSVKECRFEIGTIDVFDLHK